MAMVLEDLDVLFAFNVIALNVSTVKFSCSIRHGKPSIIQRNLYYPLPSCNLSEWAFSVSIYKNVNTVDSTDLEMYKIQVVFISSDKK